MKTITFFPTTYSDKFGKETTIIQNDGKTLLMAIRGIEFVGSMFDDFEPKHIEKSDFNSFVFNRGVLCSCEINCEIPVYIAIEGNTIESKLHAYIELGGPRSNGSIEYEKIRLELVLNDKSFISPGENGWFDDELRELNALLPNNAYLKSCYTCAFSTYNPAGYGAFGCLACFRNNKKGFSTIKNKTELLHLFNKQTETVQETWLCPEYKNACQKE